MCLPLAHIRKRFSRSYVRRKTIIPKYLMNSVKTIWKFYEKKEKYYEGPGNEKSRTDYGRFTTRLDENGDYITEKIFSRS